jgi:hypothetical protein
MVVNNGTAVLCDEEEGLPSVQFSSLYYDRWVDNRQYYARCSLRVGSRAAGGNCSTKSGRRDRVGNECVSGHLFLAGQPGPYLLLEPRLRVVPVTAEW